MKKSRKEYAFDKLDELEDFISELYLQGAFEQSDYDELSARLLLVEGAISLIKERK